ncbi:MAG: hypothetical protein ACT4O4_05185 [Nitrospiraceae bacterium]
MIQSVPVSTRSARMPRVLTAALLGLTALVTFTPSLNAARGAAGKTEVLPVEKSAPAAVVLDQSGSEQELRKQLRAKNGVAELAMSSTRFSSAPTASYGFIAPQHLGMALVTQSPDLGLERMPPTANSYEIHKLADGSGLVVGFIGPDLKNQVAQAHRPKNIRIALYSSPSQKAPHIAAVPLVKLMVDRMPIRLDPKNADSPVLLDMDLQSTANRKSVPGPQ